MSCGELPCKEGAAARNWGPGGWFCVSGGCHACKQGLPQTYCHSFPLQSRKDSVTARVSVLENPLPGHSDCHAAENITCLCSFSHLDVKEHEGNAEGSGVLSPRPSQPPAHSSQNKDTAESAVTTSDSNVQREDRLKLAPILARRLEIVASANSFSSRVRLLPAVPLEPFPACLLCCTLSTA